MATFNTKTIEKITAKISEQAVPIFAKTTTEQEAMFAKVKAFVEKDERLRTGNGSRSNHNNTWTKYLSVNLKDYDYHFPDIPSIQFDDLGRLVMYEDNYKQPYPIDFTTIPLVVNEMFKLHKIEEADKKKKQTAHRSTKSRS